MPYLSKHFASEGYDPIILEKDDWTPGVWQAFLDIFGLKQAERIVVTEYKLEAWGTKNDSP